jgi:RecA-family ATPase
MIITAGEGGGKSTLLRQMAVCAAAGLHPFTHTGQPPVRVLIVDCENGRNLLRRKLRPLIATANRYRHPVDPDRLRIISRPAGLDLGRLDDAGWLTERVVAARPDLLTIGPLYRLHGNSVDKEDEARQLVAVLDSIRSRVGCALLIEAHAPHGQFGQRALRPAGSSLFLRWPEFGYGLRVDGKEAVDVVAWRGPRDERAWPERLRRGTSEDWPWLEDVEPSSTWSAIRGAS